MNLGDYVLLAAALVGGICIVIMLASPQGRERAAELGARLALALVRYLERYMTEPAARPGDQEVAKKMGEESKRKLRG